MRLYPQRNVAEKRLAFTPQYFDAPERALLAERLKGEFVFLDVGASVGGYALFAARFGGPRQAFSPCMLAALKASDPT